MNRLEQLKATSPDLYTEIINQGVELERQRVMLHLDTASAYNVLADALENIRNGVQVNDLNALHDYYISREDELIDKLDQEDKEIEAYRQECKAKGCRSWV